MSGVDPTLGIDVLESMRERTSGIKARADLALAALRDELGDDADLDALTGACAEYHLALDQLLDALTTTALRRGGAVDPGQN